MLLAITSHYSAAAAAMLVLYCTVRTDTEVTIYSEQTESLNHIIYQLSLCIYIKIT